MCIVVYSVLSLVGFELRSLWVSVPVYMVFAGCEGFCKGWEGCKGPPEQGTPDR